MKKTILISILLCLMAIPSFADATMPLNFTAVNGPATVALVATGDIPNINLQYSVDSCTTWNTYFIGDTINLANGATAFIKAIGTNSTFNEELSYCYFSMTGNVSADGNIMSLLDETLNQTTLPDYAFRYLFSSCTSLVQAPVLPADSLSNSCYAHMFENCISLIITPELPASHVAETCCASMFEGCTSLTTGAIPAATTLAQGCYFRMYNGCTSLLEVQDLPATTLADYCYAGMFYGCTSFTQAPALPATTLANDCYEEMFKGCILISQAPALPADSLTTYCYYSMFDSCISLTHIHPLSVTSLAEACCTSMYARCSSLVVNTQAPGMQWSIPSNVQGYDESTLEGLFDGTGGTMNGTPSLGTTYYIASVTHQVTVSSNDSTKGSVTGGGTFIYGDTITLTAMPATGYQLVSWSNDSTSTTLSFVLTQDTSFTATFAIAQHSVEVNSNDSTMGGVTSGGTYIYGDTITLTATPNANHHFVAWSNNATTPTISFVLTQDTSFTATFAIDQHTVTVNSNDPTMGSVTSGGTYNYGDTITLTATPNANYHFVSWNNNATTPTISFALTGDTTFTATFAINQHTVTVNSNNPTMGSVTSGGTYNYGDTITLTATPNANYHFVSWNNNATTPTISFKLTGDTTFTATFAINQHTVTVNSNDPAMGSVTSGGTYNYGDTITLTATPNANHYFVSWSNNATTPTISFALTGDTTFTATFAINQHTVTVNSNNPTMGSVTSGGTYNYGDTITLTATPNANHHFVSWSNNATTPTISFKLTGDTTFTATFAINQHTVTVNSNDPTMGSVTSGGTYNYGDTITLTATPNANYHFVSWSNNATTPTITFVLTQDTTLTATFEADAFIGVIGDNLYWSIDSLSGELVFSGSGSTPDYSLTYHAPWYYKRSFVTHITMPAGVISHLGDYAFDGLMNLSYSELNADTLGASLFNGCSSLTHCYSEIKAVANANTMDGCNANPLLIVHDYQWYKHTYTDSLALALNIYPYLTDYTQDSLLTMNATVTLLPSYRGISVIASRHLVNGNPLHLADNCNIIWKDRLVAPLVYEFLSQGVEYLGKNSFLGCTALHRIIVTPKYWGTNGTTSDYAYAHLDSIHADAFDSIYPDIVDLYEETLYQPGKVMSYTAQKNNLDQTLLYVPDTLAATGKSMLAQYTATPYWNDNFADINNKNIVDTQYVDTASAHVAFYYQDVIDSVPVASYHAVIYKVGGTDTANIYFSNDTTFTINRLPRRIIHIVDSVTGTTTTVIISIDHSAYNPNVQEVNVQIEHLAENSNYSITISPLDALGNVLATDSCTLNTTPTIVLSDQTITEDYSDELFFPTEDTDVYLINGCYFGKYSTSLPPGVYLMREGKKWYKFAKTR